MSVELSDIEFAKEQARSAIMNSDLSESAKWLAEVERLKFIAVTEGTPIGMSREEAVEAFRRFTESGEL